MEPDLAAEAIDALRGLAGNDVIACQQYLDFARYRLFRQTLLCHAELSLHRDELLAGVPKLRIASPLRAATPQPDGSVEFTNTRGAGTLTTNNPTIIAVLRLLEKIWPRAERFEDLVLITQPLVPVALQVETKNALAQAILKLAASTLADLRTYDLPLAACVTEKPRASSLARLMAQESDTVTTLLHTHLKIEDEQGRRFLQLLDGTHDVQALTEAIFSHSPAAESRETIRKQVEGNLVTFHSMGLLEA